MALEDHACVKLDGVWIPLIGVPPSAGQEECDLCHDIFPLQHIEFNGQQFLCDKCKGSQ